MTGTDDGPTPGQQVDPSNWGERTTATLPPPPQPPHTWRATFPTPPPQPPKVRSAPPDDRSPAHLLAWCLTAGIALDVGIRGGMANAVTALAIALLVVALVTDGRLARKGSRRLALAALLPTTCLALRASPWLAASNAALALVLVTLAVLLDRDGSLLDTDLGDLARRATGAAPAAAVGPRAVQPLIPSSSAASMRRLARVGTAALVAVPVLIVLVVLLASADAVFAGILTPDVHVGPLVGHALLAVVAAVGVLVIVGASRATGAPTPRPGVFGVLEVVTMLALAAAVLGLFVVSQVVATTGAGHRIIHASGLTPAEYARRGFFQLCWAVALLLGFLGLVGRLATEGVRGHRAVRVLGGIVPLLAVGLVFVSLRRLALYDHVFGLTMLRLWVVGAATWAGVVLVLVAARNLTFGPTPPRRWVLAGALGVAATFVLFADVANPEAFVVRHDVARAEQGVPLDPAYLRSLSDDAGPALVHAAATSGNQAVREDLEPVAGCTDRRHGVAALNLAAIRADDEQPAPCEATHAGG